MRPKLLVLLVGLLVVSGSLFAHHGGAAYESTVLTMKGTITEFRFINPHSQIFFDVTNAKGEVEHWQGEVTAPNKLARAGWTKNTLKPGDVFTISGRVGKNNAHSLAINKLITPTGESLKMSESIDY